MRNLNLRLTVPQDRRVTIELPDDIEPGELDVLLVVRRSPGQPAPRDPFPLIPGVKWNDEVSLRREDMYGDDGR